MPWISYAQNFEDVLLMRALRGVQNGFYVDVGAQSPIEDSVTKAFYDIGWHGINVEPSEEFFNKLVHSRPKDINLSVFVGAKAGSREFFEIQGTGLSSGIASIAKGHARATTARTIEQLTLDDVCREHVTGEVHFLKIDVEGAEAEVIEGFSFASVRPWILVIEATFPLTAVETHANWETKVLQSGYSFVWDDGLNRFYVADEHADLKSHFAKPPNLFDDFVVAGERVEQGRQYALMQHIDGLHHQINAMEKDILAQRVHMEKHIQIQQDHLDAKERLIQELTAAREWLHGNLLNIQSSLSWRITRPLRGMQKLRNALRGARARQDASPKQPKIELNQSKNSSSPDASESEQVARLPENVRWIRRSLDSERTKEIQ